MSSQCVHAIESLQHCLWIANKPYLFGLELLSVLVDLFPPPLSLLGVHYLALLDKASYFYERDTSSRKIMISHHVIEFCAMDRVPIALF